MQNKSLAWTVAIIAALAAIIVFVEFKPNPTGEGESATTTTATSSSSEGTLDELIKSGKVKVSVSTTTVSATPKRPPPSLSYTLKISSDLSPNAVAAVKTQAADITEELKKDPASFDAWMRMGLLAKIAGDYPRAIEIWEYTGYLIPNAPEPFANLGDLYGSYLKDYAKAEAYYKIAVKNNPANPMWADALKETQAKAGH